MWEHLFDWTRDGEVWSWIRTASAALAGAVAGGAFSLLGQSRAAMAQSARDRETRQHEQDEEERIRGVQDARQLLGYLVELNALIRDHPHPRPSTRFPAPEPLDPADRWIDEWRKLWTNERHTNLRQLIELLPNERTRNDLNEIVRYLANIRRISNEGPSQGRSIYGLVSPLTDEAVNITASFIRGEPYTSKRPSFMEYVRERFEDAALESPLPPNAPEPMSDRPVDHEE